MIVNTTRLTVRPENRGELFQTIRPLLDPIRREKGCLTYRFYVDANDENSTVLIGEWESQEAWTNHLRSRDFAVLLGAITILSSPDSIDFKLLSAIADKEQLDRLRASGLELIAEEPNGADPLLQQKQT